MEALRRTGGWSLMLSVGPFTLYPLFADADWFHWTGISPAISESAAQAVRDAIATVRVRRA